MATLGEAVFDVVVNPRGMKRGMDRAEGRMESFSRRMKSLGKLGAAVGIGAFAAAIGTAGFAAIRASARFEQTEIAFTTLLGSAERAADMLAKLEQFGARTPFEFTGLAESAKQLLAMGFEAEEVMPMMRALGDATSALGGGQPLMQGLIRALGQVRAKGKVSAEEMNQFAERGIPAWEILADEIGISIPQAMKKAEQGAIGAAEAVPALLRGMTERFSGAMEAQSKTVMGRWSTIKDHVNMTLRGIGDVILETFGVGGAMGSIIDAMETIGPKIVSGFRTVAEGIKSAFDSVLRVGIGAFTAVEVGAMNFQTVWKIASTSVAKGLLGLMGSFEHFFGETLPAYLSWFGDNWTNVFVDAFNAVLTAAKNFASNMGQIIGEVKDFITSFGDDPIEINWTPMLKGFKATMDELPDVAPRQASALEKALGAEIDRLGGQLGERFNKRYQERLESFGLGRDMPTEPAAPTTEGTGEREKGKRDGSEEDKKREAAFSGVADVFSNIQKAAFSGGVEQRQVKAAERGAQAAERSVKVAEKNLGHMKVLERYMKQLTGQLPAPVI